MFAGIVGKTTKADRLKPTATWVKVGVFYSSALIVLALVLNGGNRQNIVHIGVRSQPTRGAWIETIMNKVTTRKG
jgi:hypothetical protein